MEKYNNNQPSFKLLFSTGQIASVAEEGLQNKP
jgi:hypothetical protein